MIVSQECQYALRALLDLSLHYGDGPIKVSDIARAQGIPVRFLEVILGHLKQAGFVASRRGKQGGYYLLREPVRLTVGEVVRYLKGPVTMVAPASRASSGATDFVFEDLWHSVEKAISEVYDRTTFQDLATRYGERKDRWVPMYSI